MINYFTAFEIAGGNSALAWLNRPTYFALGVAAICIGGFLLLLRTALRRRFHISLYVPCFLIIWGIGWLSFSPSIIPIFQQADALYEDYLNHRYDIIEGTVEVLRTQPKSGHAPADLIQIGRVQFEIDYFISTPAYRQTISHGGVLSNGVLARLSYKNGKILKVEIKNTVEREP
jgi:hypothetical protein